MAATRDRFAGVYAEYRPWALRRISRDVQPWDRHSVEDLTQDTFLRTWPHLGRVEVGGERPLLSTIARYAVCGHYSSRPNGHERVTTEPVAADSPVWRSAQFAIPGADVLAVEPDPRLVAALEGLPQETRDAVEMHVADGMPVSVVADHLHRRIPAVRRLADEGLAELRAKLGVTTATAAPPEHGRALAELRRRQADARAAAEQQCTQLGSRGLSTAQVAAAMGRSEGAIRAVQSRARQAQQARLPEDAPAAASEAEGAAVDPLDRARRAVAEIQQHQAVGNRHAAEEGRAQQLARWHADDQAVAVQHRGDDRGLSVLAAEGGAP
jgi:DNA-directed RNA polymerase specialized sigma24 family protein